FPLIFPDMYAADFLPAGLFGLAVCSYSCTCIRPGNVNIFPRKDFFLLRKGSGQAVETEVVSRLVFSGFGGNRKIPGCDRKAAFVLPGNPEIKEKVRLQMIENAGGRHTQSTPFLSQSSVLASSLPA